MSGTYRTFMVDPLGALSPQLASGIQTALADLFSALVGYDNFFENNWVYFNPTAAYPMGHELLVYFVPSGVSVVKNLSKNVDLSADGNTVWDAKARASEVYVNYNDAGALAKLAFHELMHNRLKLGKTLHQQGGLAAAVINSNSQLTDRNIQSMAAVLRRPATQWTAGIDMLNNGQHDPLSEYYQP